MKTVKTHSLELLSPAADAGVAIAAIKHGADAVYIGASSHGARKSASNTLDDISRVVDFAHQFRSKVYVTVNTIVYENELTIVENLCRDLYHIGVDALIVQDMALLRMNLPPIPLHASTQCDIRTPEKALFLQRAGFSQLVLARELTLSEIRDITTAVDIPVECFVHGALCVCYSGRCNASCATTGRSANRGECAQLCRLPYTLTDASGKVISNNRHLLSLRDFNASESLPDLVEAGVSSFKIEGRLKDADYVKNITAHYSILLDRIVSQSEGRLRRASYGETALDFSPNPEKSFNRGFTDYFLNCRKPTSIASLMSPKSMGEVIKDVKSLHNGDGISFFDREGNYQGVNVNKVVGNRIMTGRKVDIPRGAVLHRTFDIEWQKRMARPTSERRINIDVCLDNTGISAMDERGMTVRIPLEVNKSEARKKMDFSREFAKLGNTCYKLRNYTSKLSPDIFIPLSEISALRRELVNLLDKANLTTYPYEYRRLEDKSAQYPFSKLDFNDNVANSLARRFYQDHGVKEIIPAMETAKAPVAEGTVLMTTRHCILRELGMCKKEKKARLIEPLILSDGNREYRLRFNCPACEMEVIWQECCRGRGPY